MALSRPPETCWRRARADHVSFLVDAEPYYTVLRRALLAAEREVFVIGWDVDSRTRLSAQDPADDGLPATLLPFFQEVLRRNTELQINILAWDYSLIYAFEREPWPSRRFGLSGGSRLRFRLDGAHPPGASHHQKLVVIDDALAFCGGVDLTLRRWDTPEHGANDPRRVDHRGDPYVPMHDVHVAVDGEVARALGDLARERWARATSEHVAARAHARAAVWPVELEPHLEAVDVGIARTIGASPSGVGGVREIERLTTEAIASARKLVFIENQYLTSTVATAALAARLREPDGPEVVIVVPHIESGWLERGSMGILRARALTELRGADDHQRLHVLYPVVPNGAEGTTHVSVHSKVLAIDDRLLKVGSANLTNRSMAIDTECDLVFEAEGLRAPHVSAGIETLRARLCAEHLGCTPAEVVRKHRALGSLGRAIAALAVHERRLVPLEEVPPAPVDLALYDGAMCDPALPLEPQNVVAELVPPELHRPARRNLLVWLGLAILLVGLGALWRLGPLRDPFEFASLTNVGHRLQQAGGSPTVLLAYALAASLFVPKTLLLAAANVVLDPARAFLVAYAGGMLSACLSYGLGRGLGAKAVRRVAGRRLLRFQRQLRRGGFLAIITARILPVGNFAAINVLAGSFRLPFGAFVGGNLVGLLPGTLALTLLANRIGSVVRSPSLANVSVVVGLLVVIVALAYWARRILSRGSAEAATHAQRQG